MDIRSALIELCDAFNAHDLDRIMALFADDCVLEMPRGPEPWGSRFEGKAAVRAAAAVAALAPGIRAHRSRTVISSLLTDVVPR